MKNKLDDFNFNNFDDIVEAFDWIAKMPTPIRDWVNKNYFGHKQESASLRPEHLRPGFAVIGNLEYVDGQIVFRGEDGSGYVIAIFVKHNDGWDLKFVGKRPFDVKVDWDKFKRLIWIGYEDLDDGK